MPIYTFRNNESGEVFDMMMRIADLDDYKVQHPTHERYHDRAPSIVSGVSITGKIDDGFKDVLSKISEAHPSSPLADNHGKRSIKQVQTKRAIEKWSGGGG